VALEVALATRMETGEEAALAVTVSVAGGQAPLRLSLHLDGGLVGAWESVADLYEFRVAPLRGPRQALTVRAVDAAGRWGSRSVIVDARAGELAAAGHEPLIGRAPATAPLAGVGGPGRPLPRASLRSSVRTRTHADTA